jgi:hypothetical protein
MRPRQIVVALAPDQRTALKAELKALEIEIKLSDDEDYETPFFLLERLQKKYPTKKPILLKLIVSTLITGIFSSLLALIVEDIIYAPHLKQLICQIFSCE